MHRSSSRGFLTAVVFVAGLFTSSNAMAAVDMFLKITNITGESQDTSHAGEIEVLAWSWGASTGAAKTARGVLPAACIQDLSLTKYIDTASAQLIMNGATGVVAPEAILTMRKAGATGLEFLILQMTNVSVAAFSTGGSGGEDRLTENVTLHFESLRGEYRRLKSDGKPDTPVVFTITGVNGVCK
jgi:type VI secretion system secreted protein Hcp